MSGDVTSTSAAVCPSGMPSTDIDPWADEVLADPYPTYRTLRDLGAVVWLERFGIATLTRFDDVRLALARWQDYSSAEGVATSPMVNAALPPAIINTDPPEHDAFRVPLAAQLTVGALAPETDTIVATARALVERAIAKGEFDGLAELARPYSLTVVSDLVGIPDVERDVFPHLAESAFNVMSGDNDRVGPGMAAFGEIAERCMRMAMTPGMLCPGRKGAEMVESGQPWALISYTWPGVDTTVNAVASALHLFAAHPDQWDQVREDRTLIPSAFAEVLRLHTPVHHFTRLVTSDQEFDGVVVPRGTRVLIMYASANRDERHYPDPDRFDVTRNPVDHLAFGRGIHLCVGHNLAKMEGHTILAELAERVERFEFAGETQWQINNALHGPSYLPLRIVPA
jgi:cytochrome P450